MNDFLKLEFSQLKKESSTKPNPQKETSDLKAGYGQVLNVDALLTIWL